MLVLGPCPRLDEAGALDPHLQDVMRKVVNDYSDRGDRIVFLDLIEHFNVLDSGLWAKGDSIHLSDNKGLPLVRRLVCDALRTLKVQAGSVPAPAPMPDHVWRSIRRHAIGSRYPPKHHHALY